MLKQKSRPKILLKTSLAKIIVGSMILPRLFEIKICHVFECPIRHYIKHALTFYVRFFGSICYRFEAEIESYEKVSVQSNTIDYVYGRFVNTFLHEQQIIKTRAKFFALRTMFYR